jgi:methylglutaconyl-CoA hydratase
VDAILAAGPVAAREAKSLIRELRGLAPADATGLTAQRIARLRASEEAQEGLRAFLERRPASWVAADPQGRG